MFLTPVVKLLNLKSPRKPLGFPHVHFFLIFQGAIIQRACFYQPRIMTKYMIKDNETELSNIPLAKSQSQKSPIT